MLVLEAFAIELLLKSVLLSEGTEPGKTHDLAALFRSLHPNTKRKIVDVWDAGPCIQLEAVCNQKGFPSDLPNALVTCGKAFEKLRYAHEDPDNVIFYLGALPRLLQDHISLAHSDWVHWVERD
jgi:hypothetical protein